MRRLARINEMPAHGEFSLIQTDPRSDWMEKEMKVADNDGRYIIPTLGTNIKIKNLKKQTETDQTFYSGQLLLDYVDEMDK
jgi:hypothetical protein